VRRKATGTGQHDWPPLAIRITGRIAGARWQMRDRLLASCGVPGRADPLKGLPPGPAGRRDGGQMFVSFLPGTTSAELVFRPGKVIMNDGGC
jgi:hypothetical protein